MMFVIKNREMFDANRDCYEFDTRQNMNAMKNMFIGIE
jgi:hypothetical protein